jgi:hypothetical protein
MERDAVKERLEVLRMSKRNAQGRQALLLKHLQVLMFNGAAILCPTWCQALGSPGDQQGHSPAIRELAQGNKDRTEFQRLEREARRCGSSLSLHPSYLES